MCNYHENLKTYVRVGSNILSNGDHMTKEITNNDYEELQNTLQQKQQEHKVWLSNNKTAS
jgi:UDP-N-acetylmuramoylalanine-D-glutamate ligase